MKEIKTMNLSAVERHFLREVAKLFDRLHDRCRKDGSGSVIVEDGVFYVTLHDVSEWLNGILDPPITLEGSPPENGESHHD